MRERARSYESVAWCYEEIARLYSLGRIPETRAYEVEQMRAGDAALYVGVGCGEDALLAARCGPPRDWKPSFARWIYSTSVASTERDTKAQAMTWWWPTSY